VKKNNTQLSKTDFIQYCNCPKSLWLLKHKPEQYPKKEFSLFLEKLVKQGYEVEKYTQKLFPGGVSLFEYGPLKATEKALKDGKRFYFQAAFKSVNGAFARIDILERLENNKWHIYEVKSSSAIKKDQKHNHLKDAAFQKYVLEESGLKVAKVSIIHLNKEYIRDGEINPYSLLVKDDVTEQIDKIYEQVSLQILEALTFLKREKIDESMCSCRENTKSNHCDSFNYFNPDIPDWSIYEIGNIRKNKIQLLLDEKILKITDVGRDIEFNTRQEMQIESAQRNEAIFNKRDIKKKLSQLEFPLYFIDYETFSNAIPKIDTTKPFQQIPFQVSIHTLSEDGKLTHFEYLGDNIELPYKMLKEMEKETGADKKGSYISWHKSFEIGRNREMAKMFPEFANYLNTMNEKMFDLEDIFKQDYFDYKFHGSTSIKYVLPVMLPKLSYQDLDIQNGTMASDTWERLALGDKDITEEDRKRTRKNLLEYCELDTMAMVEIYNKLLEVIK